MIKNISTQDAIGLAIVLAVLILIFAMLISNSIRRRQLKALAAKERRREREDYDRRRLREIMRQIGMPNRLYDVEPGRATDLAVWREEETR